jgi:hypothetical protein
MYSPRKTLVKHTKGSGCSLNLEWGSTSEGLALAEVPSEAGSGKIE